MGQREWHSVQYVSWEGHYSEALSLLVALQALITEYRTNAKSQKGVCSSWDTAAEVGAHESQQRAVGISVLQGQEKPSF